MSLLSRLRGMRKRWWVLIGVPSALGLAAGIFLLVRWVQYRAYQNVDIVAILPDDAQAAVRIKDLQARWPELSKAPALVALARTQKPSRGDGPLSMAEVAELFGGSLPPEFTEKRALEALGRDVAAAVMIGGGSEDVVAATRIPFSYFLAAPFIRRGVPNDISIEFRGDILIVGTRPDWVETAAKRADSGEHGKIALELEAVAPEGEPAFWLDFAAARKDPKLGPQIREGFNSVPVREALFMLDLEATRAVSGRLVTDGQLASLEGTILLNQKLDTRLSRMFAMPDGDPGLAAMLPPTTCYATGAKSDAETSWDFVKELTKPQKGAGKRKTVSEAFGDFVSNVYLYLNDGIQSSEEGKYAPDFKAMFERDAMFVLTSEKEEPFVGITLLARVKDPKGSMEKLYQFFTWLNQEPDPKDPKKPPNPDQPFKIRSEDYRHLDVRVLEGKYDVIGKGALPAFTVIGDVLVLTSSLDTLKLIADVKLGGEPGFATSETGTALRAAAPSDGPAWAYTDVRTLRRSLVAIKGVAAKSQVERDESAGASRIRAKVTDDFKRQWQKEHPGAAWKESEHATEIDAAYHQHQAKEEERVARDMERFASRLDNLAGLAFVVRQGKGDVLEWRAVVAAEKH